MKRWCFLVALVLALCPMAALAQTAEKAEVEAYSYRTFDCEISPETFTEKLGVEPACYLTEAMRSFDEALALTDTAALNLPVCENTGYTWKLNVPEGVTATEGFILDGAKPDADSVGTISRQLWGLTFAKAGDYVITADESAPDGRLMNTYFFY
ncbi:MAG: hypothetical protein RR696_11760, partial [Clostridia bacterium]